MPLSQGGLTYTDARARSQKRTKTQTGGRRHPPPPPRRSVKIATLAALMLVDSGGRRPCAATLLMMHQQGHVGACANSSKLEKQTAICLPLTATLDRVDAGERCSALRRSLQRTLLIPFARETHVASNQNAFWRRNVKFVFGTQSHQPPVYSFFFFFPLLCLF